MKLIFLKAKNCMLRHRGSILFAFIIIAALVIRSIFPWFFHHYLNMDFVNKNIGVIGTLLGAITGGFFTLLGSIWIQQRQARIQNDIRRSNTIYKPLYDELRQIHDEGIKQNHYPKHGVLS